MKNLSFILFVFAALIMGSSVTGCGSDDVPAAPTNTTDTTDTADTTDNSGGGTVTFKNKVKVGFDDYSIVEDPDLTNGNYNKTTGNTEVIVFGTDASNGDVNFSLTFPGKLVGSYFRTLAPGTSFSIGVGTIGENDRTEYSASSTEFVINVTEYGDVGGRIKGTFSGEAKSPASQTLPITKGEFDVERRADL
jgi:hypothetical protein